LIDDQSQNSKEITNIPQKTLDRTVRPSDQAVIKRPTVRYPPSLRAIVQVVRLRQRAEQSECRRRYGLGRTFVRERCGEF
jgi:hypothetical protein